MPARSVPGAPLVAPDGFVEGADGMVYADLVEGTGDIPAEDGAVVTVEYTGWGLGPTGQPADVFDTSWARAEPYRFEVGRGRMIAGIERGVRGMTAGAVRQLRIPWVLGFGEWGLPDRLDPESDLVVDLEVLAVDLPPVAPAVDGDLAEGCGPPVQPGDEVVFDWVVWDRNGKELDTSWTRSAPTRLPVDGLRLASAILGMRAGGRRQVTIDPAVVFPERGPAPAFDRDEPVVVQIAVHAIE